MKKILGDFYSEKDLQKRKDEYTLLYNTCAKNFLHSIGGVVAPPDTPTRGIFKEGERWVVFEFDGSGVLVEDFDYETLGYAWLFMIEWGYYLEDDGTWIVFYTPSTVPEYQTFGSKEECMDWLKPKI